MRFRNATLATALVMLLAALVVGCGGGSSDSDSTAADRDASTKQQRPGSEQQAELRDCLERNGAELPSPPEGGEGGPPQGGGMPPIGGGQGGPSVGGDPSEFRDALEKCGVDPSDLPNRPGGRGGPPTGEPLDEDKLRPSSPPDSSNSNAG